ncbi:MAG: PQQ-binding-like beta-propeller repeat protein [Planctomycetaceae bacterium]|nr:PQQ-binding-like beta-propeller repeat protein [Planctomycetaceae bacterium]
MPHRRLCDPANTRQVRRLFIGLALVGLALGSGHRALAQIGHGELIPETVALRHGLHRRWVSQVHMDLSRDRLTHVTLSRDSLCIQTRNGLAQVLDAESGGTRWLAQVGEPGAPNSELAANQKYVASTNGTRLYVLDLATGKPVFERELNGVPFAAPAIDDTRVYVPMFNGTLQAFLLAKPKDDPWVFRASGHILARPLVTEKSVAWATAKGYAYVNAVDRVKMRFQLQTKGEIVSPMAARAGVIYIASRDGYAYAMSEDTGQILWRFSAGSPLDHEPVVVEDLIFLFPAEGSMFAVSADRGTERWRRVNVKQFLAHRRADAQYPGLPPCLYVADRAGKTLLLDPETGGLIDTLPTESLPLKLTNTFNDRLYLATSTGLIQCLHHPEITEPLWSLPPAAKDDKPQPTAGQGGDAASAEPETDEPAGEEPAVEDPFETEAPPE